jgi:hypothetical protein
MRAWLTLILVTVSSPPSAAACSVEYIPWQRQAVWPRNKVRAPLNTQVQVHIPKEVFQSFSARWPQIPGAVSEEPVSQLAQSIALYAVTVAGEFPVPVRRRSIVWKQSLLFVLTPRAPLRPDSEYVVKLDSPNGIDRLGYFHTGLSRDDAAPIWRGIKWARYWPAPARHWPARDPLVSCPPRPIQRAFIELAVHEAFDEGEVQFAVWLAKNGDTLDYNGSPALLTTSRDGTLEIRDLPEGARHLRIGVRAMDVTGNLSPPSEVELALLPAH